MIIKSKPLSQFWLKIGGYILTKIFRIFFFNKLIIKPVEIKSDHSYILSINNLNVVFVNTLNYIKESIFIYWIEVIVKLLVTFLVINFISTVGVLIGSISGAIIGTFLFYPLLIRKKSKSLVLIPEFCNDLVELNVDYIAGYDILTDEAIKYDMFNIIKALYNNCEAEAMNYIAKYKDTIGYIEDEAIKQYC
jgi:hypothetical protein